MQIETVYHLFAGEDLTRLLEGYVDQVNAMTNLFAVAGGLISAQDEAVASSLAKAAQEPAGLTSLGLMGSLAPLLPAGSVDVVGGYTRVGPEEVSGTPLERLVEAAQALDEAQYESIAARVSTAATTLRDASTALRSGLDGVLGGSWQGEFAAQASTSVQGFTDSAHALAGALDDVAGRAGRLQGGYSTTRTRIAEQAADLASSPGGDEFVGPVTVGTREAAVQAATEQARAVVNTEYSPAVMDANLADLDFPTAYRVVSGAGIGGAGGVDPVSAWNTDGVIPTATPAAASPSAIAAATGATAGAGAASPAGTGTAGPAGASALPVDADTEQALLTARGTEGAGAAAADGRASALGTIAGTGLNEATTAAAAPLGLASAAGSGRNQDTGAAGRAAGARGSRASGRDRERGFGSASGLLGAGGAGGAAATGAGAAASRMGGAGTLSGYGAGGPAAPGAGSAPAGAFSSSSTPGGAPGARPGTAPVGMMGAMGAAGQNGRRDGHTPAGYLVHATNTNAIIGTPPRVAPSVLGRTPADAGPAAPAGNGPSESAAIVDASAENASPGARPIGTDRRRS